MGGVAAVLIVLGLVLAFTVVVSRRSSERKRQAIASLKAEREQIGRYSIAELVDEEVRDLGLRSIPGAEGLHADVLLKVWRDFASNDGDVDRASIRYVVADGISPEDATSDDVVIAIDAG